MVNRTRISFLAGRGVNSLIAYKLGDLTSPQNDDLLKINEKMQSEPGDKQDTEQRGKNCLSAKIIAATTAGGFNGR